MAGYIKFKDNIFIFAPANETLTHGVMVTLRFLVPSF